jgi:transglutaminase-like putative cysteine protease
MRFEVIHKTIYRYSAEVSVSHHLARLAPRPLPRQHCLEFDIRVEPKPVLMLAREDYFGNFAQFFALEGKHHTLVVTARSVVEVQPRPTPDLDQESEPWETVRDGCLHGAVWSEPGVEEFIYASPMAPCLDALADYAAPSFPDGEPMLKAVLDLTRRIHKDFKFDPKATTVATPVEQVLKHRRGVCQDFAHLEIGCLRSLGLPARYVSGYLETLPPPGKPKLVGADASHAWVQVFIPSLGWLDLDPTNNLVPSERHITIGWGRDFDDISPIRGVIVGSGKHELLVAVDVTAQGE